MKYKKYFTMSYDDGVEQDKRFIELLKKYNLKCTFNVNSGLLGDKDYIVRIKDKSLAVVSDVSKLPKFIFKYVEHNKIQAGEIQRVYEGFEVASHGISHARMSGLCRERREEEIHKDMEALEKIMGYPMRGHIFPHGDYSEDAVEILHKYGLSYTRSIQSTGKFEVPEDHFFLNPTCWHGDRQIMKLLDSFIEAKPVDKNLIFVLWGHSYEFDYGTKRNSWNRIEETCRKISGHDDIVYCTNIEMMEAIKR